MTIVCSLNLAGETNELVVAESGVDFVADEGDVVLGGQFGEALDFCREATTPVGLAGLLNKIALVRRRDRGAQLGRDRC